jgi:methyl-accepting chemotaxis protein
VNDLMGEIASASDEQSRGITQIGQAVTEMDGVTQQNSALVQESAAAAASLEDQARQLTEAVSVFQLSAADAPRRPQQRLAESASAVQKPMLLAAAGGKKGNANDNWETF